MQKLRCQSLIGNDTSRQAFKVNMPWLFSWFKKNKQQPALGPEVDYNAARSEQGYAKIPGVGTVDLNCSRKTVHLPSVISDDSSDEEYVDRRRMQLKQSTVCPKSALVDARGSMTVTELYLGPNKSPVCIILAEEYESYKSPKACRHRSRTSS